MSLYRKVLTSFWRDTTDEDFTADEKLLYVYLLSNSSTTFCGVYRISRKTMLFETSMKDAAFDKAITGLVKRGKVFVDKENQEIFIAKWHKYYEPKSPTLQIRVTNELQSIKSQFLKDTREQYIAGHERTPQPIAPTVPRQQTREEIPYKTIIEYLNERSGRNFQHDTKKYRELIRVRWKEGMSLEDFKAVIDVKNKEWKGEPKSRAWITPETLFGTKMPTYLAQAPKNHRKPSRKANPKCPVCGTEHSSSNASACLRCGLSLGLFMDSKAAEDYKNQMIAAGFADRLQIKSEEPK